MVHNLTDRDLWRRQGEAYLRKFSTSAPVHPLLVAAQARRAAQDHQRAQRSAA